jgi:hypothetical protein
MRPPDPKVSADLPAQELPFKTPTFWLLAPRKLPTKLSTGCGVNLRFNFNF